MSKKSRTKAARSLSKTDYKSGTEKAADSHAPKKRSQRSRNRDGDKAKQPLALPMRMPLLSARLWSRGVEELLEGEASTGRGTGNWHNPFRRVGSNGQGGESNGESSDTPGGGGFNNRFRRVGNSSQRAEGNGESSDTPGGGGFNNPFRRMGRSSSERAGNLFELVGSREDEGDEGNGESSDTPGGGGWHNPFRPGVAQMTAWFGHREQGAADGGGVPAEAMLLGMGYIPDRPDHRDFTIAHLATHASNLCAMVKKYFDHPAKDTQALRGFADLSGQLPRVTHQGALQNCSAHAVLAMAEYHLGAAGRDRAYHPFSRLFLYKVAREILGVRGDVGCTLRETVKAMRNYGCVREERWPARPANLERMPAILDLEEARLDERLAYCRLDHPDQKVGDTLQSGHDTLLRLLYCLEDGFPVVFGFSLFDNIDEMKDGVIPEPTLRSRVVGAHAVLAVGYRLGGAPPQHHAAASGRGRRSRPAASAPIPPVEAAPAMATDPLRGGAVLVRNSWGSDWGLDGHAWLPFSYIIDQLSFDFWAQYRALPGGSNKRIMQA